MNNYYQEMEKIFEEVKSLETKPKLLLHSCCAPCNCYPMELLNNYFDITLFFNNSNIYFKDEYDIRLNELKKYLEYFNEKNNSQVQLIIKDYDPEEFDKLLSSLKDEFEGGKRCYLCYQKRITETQEYAKEHNFAYFGTVMTISRKKNVNYINSIGLSLQTNNLLFLTSDFKKKGGQEKGVMISKQFNMYRQTYCGCLYSKKN